MRKLAAVRREGLRKILGLDRSLEIVGEAASAAEVISRLSDGDVDVLLLDLLMPGASGVDLIERAIADIAGDLQLAANTVSTYKGRLMEKLGQESLSDLVRYALKLGILQ